MESVNYVPWTNKIVSYNSYGDKATLNKTAVGILLIKEKNKLRHFFSLGPLNSLWQCVIDNKFISNSFLVS